MTFLLELKFSAKIAEAVASAAVSVTDATAATRTARIVVIRCVFSMSFSLVAAGSKVTSRTVSSLKARSGVWAGAGECLGFVCWNSAGPGSVG